MIELSVMIEAALGLNWPIWKRLTVEVERLGFAGLFRSDHFSVPPDFPDALELIVSLTYLADHSERLHFSPLVAPLSFRDPIMLTRQAIALDDLSGGRMVLGVGAGWQETEHHMYGYDLNDVPTRVARLEEGLEVITLLLRSDVPVSFEGRFYQLHDAMLMPRPRRPGGPPILLGGNGLRRTLPLVARFADIWNGLALSPDEFRERSDRLNRLLQEAGRSSADVKRTLMIPVLCGRDRTELEERFVRLRPVFREAEKAPLDDLIDRLRTRMNAIVGMPDEVVEQIHAYQRAGVQEIMAQFFAPDDFDGIEILGREVLPRLA